MRIMFYINSLGAGGAQRVMSNLANYFAKNNDDIIFVTDHKTEEKYFLDEKIERIYLFDDNLGNALKKNLDRIFKLRKNIKDSKPDVVISFVNTVQFLYFCIFQKSFYVSCVFKKIPTQLFQHIITSEIMFNI